LSFFDSLNEHAVNEIAKSEIPTKLNFISTKISNHYLFIMCRIVLDNKTSYHILVTRN